MALTHVPVVPSFKVGARGLPAELAAEFVRFDGAAAVMSGAVAHH